MRGAKIQKRVLGVLALALATCFAAGDAAALVQRTFVSGLGSDANPCSRTAPCRTFAAAIAQTAEGGEVVALDSAGYGPVTIDKAISLIAPPGVYAGITTTTLNDSAIRINAGSGDIVVLEGLSLAGLDLGAYGVEFVAGKALRLEGVTISRFVHAGVYFAAVLSDARLTVADSVIRDIGTSGIYTVGLSGNEPGVMVDRTTFAGSGTGLQVDSFSRAIVRDSVASGNGNGFLAGPSPASNLTVENCLSTDNAFGIESAGLVRVAGTTVSGNNRGLATSLGGSILSRGNNTVEANDTDGTFTGTFSAK